MTNYFALIVSGYVAPPFGLDTGVSRRDGFRQRSWRFWAVRNSDPATDLAPAADSRSAGAAWTSPHDWASRAFIPVAKPRACSLPGVGWYRKIFEMPVTIAGGVFLD